MKALKLITASLLAVTSIVTAFADVTIKVTGSTSFRKAFYFAAVNSINNPKIACIDGNSDGSDMSVANRAVITGIGKVGTAYAGQTVTIQCAFAGSIGGLTALTVPSNTIPQSGFTNVATWMSYSNAAASNTSVANAGTRKITGYVNFESFGGSDPVVDGVAFDGAAVPTVCMSDAFISTTPLTGTVAEENSAASGVGIVAFMWVKGQNAGTAPAGYARLVNVTSLQANLLLSAGELPLSFFTGNSSDTGVDVLLVGRNNESGTRLVMEAEADYGFGFSTENSYTPIISGGLITGVTNVGNSSYSSNFWVARNLYFSQASGALDDAGRPFILIGFIGKGDADMVHAINANAILSFNGVKYDFYDDIIRYGAYSAWSYEHAYYTATGGNKSLIDDISKQIRLTDAVESGVLMGTMHVSRMIEGGIISP